jgi:hypothetical protein
LVVLLVSVGFAGTIFTTPALDPTSTYLHLESGDNGSWAYFVQLGNPGLGLSAGQTITLTGAGDLCLIDCGSNYSENPASFALAFTSVNTQGDNSLLDRITAIDSGAPGVDTGVTWPGGEATDIAYDFTVLAGDSISVVIPNGANWLAVGVIDSHYVDNVDNTPNVMLSIATPDEVIIPEPGTWTMVLAGLAGVGLSSLRRRKSLKV